MSENNTAEEKVSLTADDIDGLVKEYMDRIKEEGPNAESLVEIRDRLNWGHLRILSYAGEHHLSS